MKPLLHAKVSVRKFGGIAADYIDIHNWFDQTKSHVADARHRLVLHNAFGIFLCEQAFGTIVQKGNGEFVRMPYIINSSNKEISIRDVAEQHVLDDLGYIPSLDECLASVPSMEPKFIGKSPTHSIKVSSKNIVFVD